MIDLGTLGGGASMAWGINNSGQVVGWSWTSSGEQHAFFYSGGVITDLNSSIPPDSVWTLGANYDTNIDINNLGQIVGWGLINEQMRAFLMTPTTLTVCPASCDYITIQGAINAAANGSTILVSAGTYTENINFNGKAITVKGAKGAAQTIINGGGLGTVVTFGSGEGNNSVLDGFTITGGNTMDWGGGIRIYSSSSPTIKNNVITGNTADSSGGAIRIHNYSSPVISNNTITGNTSLYGAGGISVARYSSPVITNNIVWGNGTEIIDNPSRGPNTITVSYSIVQGGYTGTGNINADPLFIDPLNGDYHLQSGSPAIDTGMNASGAAYGSVVDDIQGTLRPLDGDGLGAGTTGDGSDYDIGAYEYNTPVTNQYTLTITKGDTGSGTVTSSPSGIDCGADCQEAYNSNTVITLTVTPGPGTIFTGWAGSEDCSDGVVTMDTPDMKTCWAIFDMTP